MSASKVRYHFRDGTFMEADALSTAVKMYTQVKDLLYAQKKEFGEEATELREAAKASDVAAAKFREAALLKEREAADLRKAARLRERQDRAEAKRQHADAVRGGQKTKHGANLLHEALDQRISELLAPGHNPRDYLDEFVREHHTPLRTVYRRIALEQK